MIWGDRIFVTTAVSENEREKLVIGGYPGGQLQDGEWERPVDRIGDAVTLLRPAGTSSQGSRPK